MELLWTVLIILVLAAAAVPLTYFVWMHTARLQRRDADALIVLGYRCDNDQVHPILKERLDAALQLFRERRYRYVILSGGAVRSKFTEAEIMRDYMIAQGMPPERIIMETRSRNTVHNVVNCKLLMEEFGLSSCLLVSNSFHIRRMHYIMKRLDIPASFYAARTLSSIVGLQRKLTFQEIKAYRLTLPWIEKALNMPSRQMMGK
ncbi:YdcF family protein [Paenibacillus allorhizosphaerae]|uniref:DUF218 domain-containing protein n=1 Tax=Paenibacillus allorhizosphaerae TaxID=2849866 RepID=A0ABM8VFL2_9BACL|nr:YdcF family protein [Paenibacillus allorhizosphaerae]CAG7635394.1 hypothetical protein PAECIP111802_02135 [Paenibacillus allorhizosphaerae]